MYIVMSYMPNAIIIGGTWKRVNCCELFEILASFLGAEICLQSTTTLKTAYLFASSKLLFYVQISTRKKEACAQCYVTCLQAYSEHGKHGLRHVEGVPPVVVGHGPVVLLH